MITRNDGPSKDDCERKSAKKFFKEFRRKHSHLKVIVVEDALSSNGPHIKELKKYDLRFILGAKPGDHKALFADLQRAVDDGNASEFEFLDSGDRQTGHFYKYLNDVPLNKLNQELLVNILEYHQVDKNEKRTRFSRVTDIEITDDNIHQLIRAGRARW